MDTLYKQILIIKKKKNQQTVLLHNHPHYSGTYSRGWHKFCTLCIQLVCLKNYPLLRWICMLSLSSKFWLAINFSWCAERDEFIFGAMWNIHVSSAVTIWLNITYIFFLVVTSHKYQHLDCSIFCTPLCSSWVSNVK